MLSIWLSRHFRLIWWLCFFLSGIPVASLLYDYLHNDLGPNPLETLIHQTGRWGFIFILLSFSITPLRRALTRISRYMHAYYGKRLADWNWVIRLRRMIGLYSFVYVSVHLIVYIHFDIYYSWIEFREDVIDKPYIIIGVASFILLIPLVVTSTNRMMKALGEYWFHLHRLIYVVIAMVVLHFWWHLKPGVIPPWGYLIVVLVLFGYRVLAQLGVFFEQPRDKGQEVDEKAAPVDGLERRDFTKAKTTS